jgi:hypothetical protein
VKDGQDVLDEFVILGNHCLIENQEFDSMLMKDPFKKFERETGQSVSMGNHNLRDISSEDLLQNPFKSWTFPVDTGADIRDDGVIGEFGSHESDLSIEIFALSVGTDAAVDEVDELFRFCGMADSVEFVCEEFVKIVEATPSWHTDGLDVPFVRPTPERVVWDPETFPGNAVGNEANVFLNIHETVLTELMSRLTGKGAIKKTPILRI